MQTDQTYKVEFDIFMKEYKKGVTDGEEVGRMTMRMVQYYAEINNRLCDAEVAYNRIYAEYAQEGAANKAEINAKASEEGVNLISYKTDLKNVEQMINSLKSLQKGINNEYQHMSI